MSYYAISMKDAERAAAERAKAREEGVVRKAFLALKEDGTADIGRVPYGNEIARIRVENGRFTVELESREMRIDAVTGAPLGRYMTPELLGTAPAGVVPVNKRFQDQTIPCGVCVLVGAAGVGKTPVAHALASHGVDTYGLVRLGEPFTGYSSSQAEACIALAQAMCAHENVVVDSIKDLLSMGGSLMKGGLSRNALLDLSTWSILAAHMGCTLYVPLNPSSSDSEVITLLIEAAKSNATMTLAYAGEDTWAGLARTGEGGLRDDLRFTFPRSGVAKPTNGVSQSKMKVTLSGQEFSELLRRATIG